MAASVILYIDFKYRILLTIQSLQNSEIFSKQSMVIRVASSTSTRNEHWVVEHRYHEHNISRDDFRYHEYNIHQFLAASTSLNSMNENTSQSIPETQTTNVE